MNTITITGTISHISEPEIKGNFKTRFFVITTESKFNNEIKIDCIKDKCDALNLHVIGHEVEVSTFLNGKSFVGNDGIKKWFNCLSLNTIRKV
jgi:hypothetical protein